MTISCYYQFPFTDWTVFNVFDSLYLNLKKKYPKINWENKNTSEETNRKELLNIPNHFYPHTMYIGNLENGKFYVISYWDNASELDCEFYGWDLSKRVGLITSAGSNEKINSIPCSYLPYKRVFDELSKTSRPIKKKEENKLFFKGYLYGNRIALKSINLIEMSNIKTNSEKEYFYELERNKINLSLNGAAEICNRDIEILSSRSVLLRPKLNQKFHNELIPDYHYVSFELNDDPKIQSEIILDTYNKIKDDEDYLTFISENGFKWYKKNGTCEANIKIIKKLIDVKKLK
jgi:hypothetical protein